MEKRILNIIADTYYSFKENINEIKERNDDKITYYECYLVDEIWFNEFESILKENKNNESSLLSIIPFPKNIPQILDTFQKTINFLKNNKNIYFINTSVIELMYSNNPNIDLKYKNSVQICPIYNNIIIEFKKTENNEDKIKSLLLVNALTKNQTNIFITNVKFENIIRFKKKLKDFKITNEIGQNSIDKNCIIPLKEHLNSINIEKNRNTTQTKGDLLKFFIYIFYYEKSFIDNKYNYNNFLSDFQNYYLINYEWVDQLKKYYNYDELYNLLKLDEKNVTRFNFSNLRQKVNDLLNKYTNEDNFILKPLDIPQNLMDIGIIVSPKTCERDIQIYENCFIVNSEIIKIINNYIVFNKEIDFQNKKLAVKHRELVLFDENNVVMYGSLTGLIFVIKYVILYQSSEILNSEKKLLSSNSFYKYLSNRKAEINSFNKQQLINEENNIIGQLIFISNREDPKNIKNLTNNKSQSNFYKPRENKKYTSNSNELTINKEGDNKDALFNKKNIEKPPEKSDSKKEEKNFIENDNPQSEINDLNNLNEKKNELFSLINPLRECKINKNKLNRDENKDFKIKKDKLLEKRPINQKKAEGNKRLNKKILIRYNYFEQSPKEERFTKNNNLYIKKSKSNYNNIQKGKKIKSEEKYQNGPRYNLQKVFLNNEINNEINNVKTIQINPEKVSKLKNKENSKKLRKKEEENMKTNKLNNSNSIMEEYHKKFNRCILNIHKIEEIIEAISNKLKAINYTGVHLLFFNILYNSP